MPHQEVCGPNAVTRTQGGNACVSSCTYFPEVEPTNLICGIQDAVDLATVKPGAPATTSGIGEFGELYTWCSLCFRAFCMRVCECFFSFFFLIWGLNISQVRL